MLFTQAHGLRDGNFRHTREDTYATPCDGTLADFDVFLNLLKFLLRARLQSRKHAVGSGFGPHNSLCTTFLAPGFGLLIDVNGPAIIHDFFSLIHLGIVGSADRHATRATFECFLVCVRNTSSIDIVSIVTNAKQIFEKARNPAIFMLLGAHRPVCRNGRGRRGVAARNRHGAGSKAGTDQFVAGLHSGRLRFEHSHQN